MIQLKSAEEIRKMRESNRIVAVLLKELEEIIRPGCNTKELDKFADDLIRKHGGTPAFKGYTVPGLPPFPGAICASLNSGIVHGIPSEQVILKEGDIIGIDVGVCKDGYYGDGAKTYCVGSGSELAVRLLQVTEEALYIGIEAARVGQRVGDISHAIGEFVTKQGFYIADDLTGHGIGRHLHEDPMVPNIGFPGRGPRLQSGMTIAIEPMVNVGTNRVKEKGWEFFVADNTLSAHFEHTILITDSEPEILTRIG